MTFLWLLAIGAVAYLAGEAGWPVMFAVVGLALWSYATGAHHGVAGQKARCEKCEGGCGCGK